MPFTLSHAVVALPFIRTPLVPAAIAVGAMTPDLPLFLRGIGPSYAVTHNLGWLPATMAVALVLLLVWRCVLRPAVRELAPSWLAVRLPSGWERGAGSGLRETFPSVPGVVYLVVSLAIGVVSHIAWDLFTHEGRGGVQALPLLDEQWGPFVGFKWLQYASSALGLVGLALWAAWWLRRRHPLANNRLFPAWARVTWWLSLPIMLTAAAIWGYASTGPLTAEWTVTHIAYLVLPPACGIWGAGTLLLALAIIVTQHRQARQAR